jgi:hypothetical protein
VLASAIEDHAEQFESELPLREPGSDEELQASVYILGHLQDAGYVPLLDAVPVGDLVESTNLVALPVGGAEPQHLVAVSYGNTEAGSGGEAIGVFLELARALNAANQDHAVAFVALAAEGSPRLGASLGTRRLLQYLEDEDLSPHVITLAADGSMEEVRAAGSRAEEVIGLFEDPAPGAPLRDDIYARARLEHTVIFGPPDEVGEVLLDYLDD